MGGHSNLEPKWANFTTTIGFPVSSCIPLTQPSGELKYYTNSGRSLYYNTTWSSLKYKTSGSKQTTNFREFIILQHSRELIILQHFREIIIPFQLTKLDILYTLFYFLVSDTKVVLSYIWAFKTQIKFIGVFQVLVQSLSGNHSLRKHRFIFSLKLDKTDGFIAWNLHEAKLFKKFCFVQFQSFIEQLWPGLTTVYIKMVNLNGEW